MRTLLTHCTAQGGAIVNLQTEHESSNREKARDSCSNTSKKMQGCKVEIGSYGFIMFAKRRNEAVV